MNEDMCTRLTTRGFQCSYINTNTAFDNQTLAQIKFDARCEPSTTQGHLSTGLQFLAGAGVYEHLFCDQPVNIDRSRNLYCAYTDTLLLVALWIDEKDAGGLRRATEACYKLLLDQIQAHGYPYLVRIWNYFADINCIEDSLERYQQFCVGRFEAFASRNIARNQYPSACALGHRGGDLLVYALACKVQPQHFENPVQASAYEYPPLYGPRSPSFARASLTRISDEEAILFLSGTASVVGHTTQHPNDLQQQIFVTLNNIGCLLEHIITQERRTYPHRSRMLVPTILKVYVRHKRDLPAIQQQINQAYPRVPTVYVAADICRADLLLEIDGIWNLVDQ